jgi:FlaA1/EpsC-like NDP-sugar epimerase
MVTGSRASFRVISEALQRRRQTGRRVVIYGAGDGGAMAMRELLDPDHAVRIVGLIDDDPRKRRTRVRGFPVLGAYESLRELIAAGQVDAVVLSTRAIDAARVRELEALCRERQVQLTRLIVGLESLVDPDRGVAAGATYASGKVRKFQILPRSDR